MRVSKKAGRAVSKASATGRANVTKLGRKKKALIRTLKDARKTLTSLKPRLKGLETVYGEQLSAANKLWDEAEALGGDLVGNPVESSDSEVLLNELMAALDEQIASLDNYIKDAGEARKLPRL